MHIFFYDKTFEGLLTAVFDAYNRKVFPDRLLREGEIPPLFADGSFTVCTDSRKSERVWAAVEKKLSRPACNMVTYAWLSETEGSDELIFRFLRKTIDSDVSIETNFGDKDVLELHRIAKKVAYEAQYLKMFVRFQKAADDTFFAPVSPEHNALPIAIEHFTDRFADQKWIIYDVRRHYGFYYDLHRTIEITFDDDSHLLSGKLDEKLMAEDEKMFQELWRSYFNAMTIKERLNLRKQRQDMPKRFWKYLTEKQ